MLPQSPLLFLKDPNSCYKSCFLYIKNQLQTTSQFLFPLGHINKGRACLTRSYKPVEPEEESESESGAGEKSL